MSKAVTLTLPHELGRAEAKQRIDEGIGTLGRHMGAASGALTKAWNGDRLDFSVHALGQGVSGSVEVQDAAIRLEVLLPDLLAMLAEPVKGRLRRQARLLLDKK